MKQVVAEKRKRPSWEKCQMCKERFGKHSYLYKPKQFVDDWIPESLFVCRKCVYREIFGSKNFRKKMKEGVLDGES